MHSTYQGQKNKYNMNLILQQHACNAVDIGYTAK